MSVTTRARKSFNNVVARRADAEEREAGCSQLRGPVGSFDPSRNCSHYLSNLIIVRPVTVLMSF